MTQPSISIVTVTRDRRRFIPHLIETITKQTIQKSELEWIILDDGNDAIGDLVRAVPYARYYYTSEKLTLGYKRNLGNYLSRGQYIFYFDDDNYAFPHRVEAGVFALLHAPKAMIVGSSDMFIYDRTLRAAYVAGPFGPNHATLGTWGVRRPLLSQTRFDDFALRGEEVTFTAEWTIPIVQVGRSNTSVCFDHGENTISKAHLAAQASELLALEDVILDPQSRDFFRSF